MSESKEIKTHIEKIKMHYMAGEKKLVLNHLNDLMPLTTDTQSEGFNEHGDRWSYLGDIFLNPTLLAAHIDLLTGLSSEIGDIRMSSNERMIDFIVNPKNDVLCLNLIQKNLLLKVLQPIVENLNGDTAYQDTLCVNLGQMKKFWKEQSKPYPNHHAVYVFLEKLKDMLRELDKKYDTAPKRMSKKFFESQIKNDPLTMRIGKLINESEGALSTTEKMYYFSFLHVFSSYQQISKSPYFFDVLDLKMSQSNPLMCQELLKNNIKDKTKNEFVVNYRLAQCQEILRSHPQWREKNMLIQLLDVNKTGAKKVLKI